MKNANQPTYPIDGEAIKFIKAEDNWLDPQLTGLTKRERFAMAAMQGMLSCMSSEYAKALKTTSEEAGMDTRKLIAHMATDYADHLLAELEKEDS